MHQQILLEQQQGDSCVKAVYISWPFISSYSLNMLMEKYLEGVKKEIGWFTRCKNGQKVVLDSLYIGGGQLESCPDALLLDMSGTLKEVFCFNDSAEVTAQAGAGDIQWKHFECWKRVGINRISIGIYQPHTIISQVKTVGSLFRNIALDVRMYLTGSTVSVWKQWMLSMISDQICQISISFVPTEEVDCVSDFYYWLKDYLQERGYVHYEIYGFALPGFQARHTQHYLARETYQGFGLGATSFNGHTRFKNEHQLMRYLQTIIKDQLPIIMRDDLQSYDIFLERLMLGLRLAEGVSLTTLEECLDTHKQHQLREAVALLVDQGLLHQTNESILLTRFGLLYEHEVVLKLSI